ncbi:MAG TPA: hypothetical protein VFI34_05590, partial [Candidatus Limnocylindrales bacterium]|nr:hypothetical protein [Candidatus Limnocylindrales bacterium]
SKALWIAGVDVVLEPGAPGNRPGVPIESVALDQTLQGVSSLTFQYEDPLSTGYVPADDDPVLFWDLERDYPLFGGFVTDTVVIPFATGRIVSVRCTGRARVLDGAKLTASVALAAGLDAQDAILAVVAAAAGIGGLQAAGSGTTFSDVTRGVAQLQDVALATLGLAYELTIPAGVSVRGAIDTIARATTIISGWAGATLPQIAATVDDLGHLRILDTTQVGYGYADVRTLSVDPTPVRDGSTENLEHERDAAGTVRGVFIQGANAAGTGLALDGSGREGAIAVISDGTIDTAAKLADAQAHYLGQFATTVRGHFDLEWSPAVDGDIGNGRRYVRAGGPLVITALNVGVDVPYRIETISRRFLPGGAEAWTVHYGGGPAWASQLVRTLTRNIQG